MAATAQEDLGAAAKAEEMAAAATQGGVEAALQFRQGRWQQQ